MPATHEIDDLMVRVRASLTKPGFMPAVHLDELVYLEGAMGDDGGILISQAHREGLEEWVIVLKQERKYRKAPQRFSAVYRQVFGDYPAMREALLTRRNQHNDMSIGA